MGNPYVFGGASFFYEDINFQNQPYNGFEDSLTDSHMTCIDPCLQTRSPNPYPSAWTASAQQTFKEASTTALFVPELSRQAPNRAPTQPALGVSPVPAPSQVRFASPISSIEPSSAGGAFSPPADTESYYDNYPRTPPDAAVLSPFQALLPLEPIAHAVQFRSMGPDYVNPSDVNPSQLSEYCESDNGIADFSFPQQGYSFDLHAGYDAEPAQGATVPNFTARQASPVETRMLATREREASSQYPLPKEEDVTSDDEVPAKRQNDDDDGDYRPYKRTRTSTRTSRRGVKGATTTASPSARRTRTRANNLSSSRSLTSSSAHATKTPLTCPNCERRTFASQSDLDAHIRKQHIRSFNCVFDFAGCTSTFPSKNEWKRHVATQHLLLHYWVCTEGTCANAQPRPESPSSSSPSSPATHPNGAIFNRKDLFTQHLKRMHAPPEVKDHLPPKRTSGTSANSRTTPAAVSAILTGWEARVRALQETCIRDRCHLPTLMRCPVPRCPAEPFRGRDAWNQYMEHLAKHMDRAAQGGEGRVVFGGPGDDTLVEWAAREDVAIIVPKNDAGDQDGEGEWVLKAPLKRGPGGNVVVLAPVHGAQAGVAATISTTTTTTTTITTGGGGGDDEDEVVGEIVVVSQDEYGDEGDEEDAEGEDDE